MDYDEEMQENEDDMSIRKKRCCCGIGPNRLRFELSKECTMFSIEEPSGGSLHVEKVFAPRGLHTLLIRLFFFSWSTAAFVSHILRYPRENLYIFAGFMTNWVWFLVICYQFLAVLLSTTKLSLRQPGEGDSPFFFVRLTWVMFSIACPLQILVSILFFVLQSGFSHTSTTTYLGIMEFGVVLFMIIFDGFILGSIPIKLKQIIFPEMIFFFYLIWTLIHDFTGIGNGMWEIDEDGVLIEKDPGSLYPFLAWKTNTISTAIFFSSGIFLAIPVCYFLLWFLSLVSTKGCNGQGRSIYGGALGGI